MQYQSNFVDYSVLEFETSLDGFLNTLISGKEYEVGVSAQNLAGESNIVSAFIIVGETPSPPLDLKIEEVVPSSNIKISWKQGYFSGGIPLRSYVLNVNGIDQATVIDPSDTQIDFSISTGLGSSYTFKLKAVNDVDESDYSEPLIVPVGILPNAPTVISSFAT